MILVIDKVYKEVEKLLASDNSGHGMDHINRVVRLAGVLLMQRECSSLRRTWY